jgi:methylglutaconyl-CoA hydratase
MDKHPGCGVVKLNRPELNNAFNETLIQDITNAFKLMAEKKPRAVLFSSTGPSFSAGADLNWMKKMATYSKQQNEDDARLLFEMFYSIRNCPVPVIARVQGAALGGGGGLVSACDMAFAVSSAKFGFTEVKLGLIPAVISPFVMEKIGANNASRYFLTGERFSANDAKQIGLITQTFEDEGSLDAAVDQILTEIEGNSPQAVQRCKSLIQHVKHKDVMEPSTKAFVAHEIADIRVSSEGQEGLQSFLNKRKPSWILPNNNGNKSNKS